MNDQPRDLMDQAIDRVAARLVSVEQDEAIVGRIVAQLPERSAGHAWLTPLGLQAAVAVCVALLAFAWTTLDRGGEVREPRPALRASSPVATATGGTEVPPYIVTPYAVTPYAVTPYTVLDVSTDGRVPALQMSSSGGDHERSLAPVAALVPLDFAALEAPSLPDESLVLAPIVLTELPLSIESISRR